MKLKKIIVQIPYLRSPYWELKVRDGNTKAELRCMNKQLIATIIHCGGSWILSFKLFGDNIDHTNYFTTMESAMDEAPVFIFENINKVFKILN